MPEESEIFRFFEEPEIEKPKRGRAFFRGFLGILIIGGLIYLSGIYQALFYSRTSPEIEQPDVESVLDAETVTLPVRVFVFNNSESFGSGRTEEDVRQMVRNASEVWNQADIDFEIEKIVFLEMSDLEIGNFLNNPREFLAQLHEYDLGAINVFLLKTLKGIQGVDGLSFGGLNAVVIADLTVAYDFRVLAHEIGHLLSLKHTEENKNRLMYSGVNGIELTVEEIMDAREKAADLRGIFE